MDILRKSLDFFAYEVFQKANLKNVHLQTYQKIQQNSQMTFFRVIFCHSFIEEKSYFCWIPNSKDSWPDFISAFTIFLRHFRVQQIFILGPQNPLFIASEHSKGQSYKITFVVNANLFLKSLKMCYFILHITKSIFQIKVQISKKLKINLAFPRQNLFIGLTPGQKKRNLILNSKHSTYFLLSKEKSSLFP